VLTSLLNIFQQQSINHGAAFLFGSAYLLFLLRLEFWHELAAKEMHSVAVLSRGPLPGASIYLRATTVAADGSIAAVLNPSLSGQEACSLHLCRRPVHHQVPSQNAASGVSFFRTQKLKVIFLGANLLQDATSNNTETNEDGGMT